MAAISKPQTVSYTCYELGHTWTPSCTRAFLDVALLVAKEAIKIYGTLFVAAGLVRRRGKSYFKKKIWKEILQSTLFLATNGSVFIGAFCVWRKIAGFYFYPNAIVCGIPASAISLAIERKERKMIGSFNYTNTLAFIPAVIGSFTAILVERKSRRGLLAVYMANVALETLWRMFEARGWVKSIPNGEVLLFSVASAVYLYYFKKPNGLPVGTMSIFKKFLDSDETATEGTTDKSETKVMMRFTNQSLNVSFRKFLGSDETVTEGNTEVTETNDVLKAQDNGSTEINDVQKTKIKNRSVVGGTTSQRGATVWKQVLIWAQSGPSHTTCKHKHGCVYYALQSCVQLFGVGYGIQAAIKLVSSLGRVINQPKTVIQALFNRNNTQLGAFLGCFVGIFKVVNCLLRWLRERDDSKHGLLAGFLAGWSMMFYKGPTLALYTASKLAETLYFKGITAGSLPYIKCADIIIYSISTALVFHAAVLEPHNLRPAYWKFLLRVTGDKFAGMNRRLLDPFVPNCSKINPDYWPDYDPRYTDLARR